MVQRIFFSVAVLAGFSICVAAQNFSGLQYKKLNRADDVGTLLESLISRLGGSVDGELDSVVVTGDYENELQLKIYYTGFINGYFSVSTMSESREREPQVAGVRFSQAERNSPAECILKLNTAAAREALKESPYLRIDIAKRADRGGKVKVFMLRKSWVMSGGSAAPNMLIRAVLQPVGVASTLNLSFDNSVMPPKKIRFNKAVLDNKDGRMKISPARTSGGNSVPIRYSFTEQPAFADISGTWLNVNKTAPGISKLIVSNNNYIRVFNKTSGSAAEYELTKGALAALNATQFRAQFIIDSKLDQPAAKATLDLNLVNNQLAAKYTTRLSNVFNPISKTYNYTFQKEIKTVKVNPGIYTMEEYKVMLPDKNPPVPVSTEAEGAGNNVIYLWDGIAVDNQVDFKNPQDISNINMTVVPDKNPHSGIYYILPADFHLTWNPAVQAKSGYGLSISYGKQTGEPDEENTDAPVRMSAILTAGISNREKSFVRNLLKATYSNFREIKNLPLRENLETTFPATLSALYNIPADRIAVTAGMDFTNSITVAWRTDADTKEFIQTALTSGEGIAAEVILKPKNEQLPDMQVGAGISVSDARSFGKMELDPKTWRTQEWRNQTLYPLKLKYLHVLRKSPTQTSPVIYSWSMNNLEVPSQARVSFDNGQVPVWLDNDPTAFMWIDYSVLDCSPCKDSVIVAVTDGVSGATAQQVKINIPPAVYDTLKAVSFMVTIRSRQADPKGTTLIELPALKVTRDAGKVYLIGPLFIPKGGTPDFEFNIKAESADGDFYISEQWIKSSEKELLLGRTRMKEYFKGLIPGIE